MASKSAAKRVVTEIGEELGLDVKRSLFRQVRATGLVNGAAVEVRLGSSREIIGYSDAASWQGFNSHHVGSRKVGAIKGSPRFGAVARTAHGPLGLGLRINPTSTNQEDRSPQRLVLTGDSVFDAALLVNADDADVARRFLDTSTRATIVAFFEAGASAIITDDEIQVVASGSARVMAPQIRNAARMSALLNERHTEL